MCECTQGYLEPGPSQNRGCRALPERVAAQHFPSPKQAEAQPLVIPRCSKAGPRTVQHFLQRLLLIGPSKIHANSQHLSEGGIAPSFAATEG